MIAALAEFFEGADIREFVDEDGLPVYALCDLGDVLGFDKSAVRQMIRRHGEWLRPCLRRFVAKRDNHVRELLGISLRGFLALMLLMTPLRIEDPWRAARLARLQERIRSILTDAALAMEPAGEATPGRVG